MKKNLIAVALLFTGLGANVQAQNINIGIEPSLEIQALIQAFDLIEWKVGDQMTYDLSMILPGKMVNTVTKDEGTALWFKSESTLLGRTTNTETLIEKATGKILRVVRDGQDVKIEDDPLEIISQDYAEITVKAGKFESIHVIAKNKASSRIEVWVNFKDTAMDGTLKLNAATSLGTMKLELVSFKRN